MKIKTFERSLSAPNSKSLSAPNTDKHVVFSTCLSVMGADKDNNKQTKINKQKTKDSVCLHGSIGAKLTGYKKKILFTEVKLVGIQIIKAS